MAAIPPLQIPCPVCGNTIEVPVTATFEGTADGAEQFTVTIAREPIQDHIAEHSERIRVAREKFGWTPQQVEEMPDELIEFILRDAQ
ncbi:hypothetical protein ACFXI6_14215 [Streptomyces mirabilis]|uniref:hypothetical protein n=1 Tax=Streptomyces mirabilis TaxID=68239 RepID=UPI0036918968